MSSRPGDEPIEKFIKEVKVELDKGYAFTPFIGAGVSAASGMMIGSDFDSYLAYAIYRCVAPDGVQPIGKRWNLLDEGWLRRPTGPQFEEATSWFKARMGELREALGGSPTDPRAAMEPSVAPVLKPRFWDNKKDGEWPNLFEENSHKENLERHGAEKSAWKSQIEAACRHWEGLDRRGLSRDVDRRLDSLRKKWAGEEIKITFDECPVVEKALRSLYDWKAMLTFLSHLKLEGTEKVEKDQRRLTFQPIGNPLIIDRFNLHISWGQKPNLAHTQLVHLARPLRIRQIFTTNFDTLVEQAFQEVQIPLRLIETTIAAGLPDESLVLGANCLVKFHGGAQQTRADFSLNEPATPEDRNRFVSYLRQRRTIGENSNCCHVPSHLLLLGLSGSDWRVIDLIHHALWSLPELKVFVIANSESSEATFKERLKGWTDEDKGQVKIFKLGRADLALLRLYQELTLTLPPGGFSSQFTQYVPAGEPDDTIGTGKITYKDLATLTIQAMEDAKPQKADSEFRPLELPSKPGESTVAPEVQKWLQTARPAFKARIHREARENSTKAKSSWIAVATGHSGIMRYFQALFEEEVRNRKQCVWLELEDYGSCEELTAEFLRVLSLNRGRYQTAHVDLDRRPKFKDDPDLEDFSQWIERVMDYLDLDPTECSLFFYGRNGAGGCSRLRAAYWDSEKYENFEKLLNILFERGFRIYYLPFSEDRWKRNQQKEGAKGGGGIQQRINLIRQSAGPQAPDAIAQFGEYRSKLWPEDGDIPGDGFVQRLAESIIHRGFGETTQPQPNGTNANDPTHSEFEDRIDQVCANFIIDLAQPANRISDANTWAALQTLVTSDGFAKDSEGAKVNTPWTRLQFLYACSLFRQSRHPSGLISEGAFSCPFSFNVSGEDPENSANKWGIDNDLLRSTTAGEWTDRLREIKLFRDKPGGFLWQYRDTRLGIQALLESLTNLKLGPDKELEFLGQRRARLHFWIGDWYRDAFMATRHVVPMIESLYHRCAAIHFARWAKPSYLKRDTPEVAKFRLHLVLASLTEIIDLLELGAPEAGFWQPGTTGSEIFSKEALLKAIDWTFPTATDIKEREQHASTWVEAIIGTDPSNTPELKTYISTMARMIVSLEVSAQSISGRLHAEDSPGFAMQIRSNTGAAFFGSQETPSLTPVISRLWLKGEQKKAVEILKSIATESFGEKHKQAWLWIYDFEGFPIEDEGKTLVECRRDRKLLVASSRNTLSQAILANSADAYEALQSMAEAAYIGIKITKLKSRRNQVESKPGDSAPESEDLLRWVRVSMICSVGLSLLRVCHSARIEDRILLRQKFLAFYALSLGFLGRFHEAHRRLNQANALCRFIPRFQSEMASIILRIRRAEVHLAEAQFLAYNSVSSEGSNELILARRIAAKVDDAVVSLEAAEHLLQGRSQSSLWWGRFYSLRLRAIAISATLAEKHPEDSSERVVSLALRRRHDYFGTVREIFGRADLLCQEDTYRHLRTIDYTIKAIIGIFSISGKRIEAKNFLKELRTLHPKFAEDLFKAFRRIRARHIKERDQWCREFRDYYARLERLFAETQN